MKLAPDIPHLDANEAQPSPGATWIVVQSPRGLIDRAFEAVVEFVVFVPSKPAGIPLTLVLFWIGTSGGAVTKMGPVKFVVCEKPPRHRALDHDWMAAWAAVKVALTRVMTPKTWSASRPGPQTCMAMPPEKSVLLFSITVPAKVGSAISPIPSFSSAAPT
jgi:hypothetical protein